MEKRARITDRFAAWKRRLQRTRLECRECEVICERVVSPQHCLDSGCSSVYVYDDDDGSKMFGCLHKIFAPELDLAAFTGKSRGRGSDVFGPVRLNRSPRKQCRVTVEQAYPAALTAGCCSNPTFFHQPSGPLEERIRLTTNIPSESQPQD